MHDNQELKPAVLQRISCSWCTAAAHLRTHTRLSLMERVAVLQPLVVMRAAPAAPFMRPVAVFDLAYPCHIDGPLVGHTPFALRRKIPAPQPRRRAARPRPPVRPTSRRDDRPGVAEPGGHGPMMSVVLLEPGQRRPQRPGGSVPGWPEQVTPHPEADHRACATDANARRKSRALCAAYHTREGIVKLFENDCGAVDVSLFGGQIYWLTRSFMPLRWQ